MCARIRIFQGGAGGDRGSQQQKAEERRAAVEDMKNSILSQVLSQEARARRKYLLLNLLQCR